IVVVQNPTKGSYYAANVAGPVFREVADMIYASDLQMYANVEEPKIVGNTRMPKVKDGNKKSAQKVYSALGIKPYFASANKVDVDTNQGIAYREVKVGSGIVPDVSGMGLRDALYVLGNAGLNPVVKGSGEVYEQSIPPGAKVAKGTKITIELR
ncbi:PASTA domain-containing protein, partial [Pseudoxanthomonas sp. SGD-10]